MRNHTTPKIFDLSGPQGKSAALTLGGTPQTATFNLTQVPTGKEGRMWYYTTAIVAQASIVVNQPGSGGTALDQDMLAQCLQSARVYSPLLGEIYSHNNTRGAVLKNIIEPICLGFNRQDPVATQIGAAEDRTQVVQFRIPFTCEFLRKPHETSPWGGFLEGGAVELRFDLNTILSSISTGNTVDSVTVSCWLEMIPSPEAVIHTPMHFREHANLPGNTTRTTITDMGASDGLLGIDQTRGVGLAHLLYLTNATGIGLSGAGTAANIIQVEIPWRDQTITDNPDAFFASWFAMMGPRRRQAANDVGGFPYTLAATLTGGSPKSAAALVFPLVTAGRDSETSKFQTVIGAKDLNFRYTSTPSGAPRILGQYFPVFSDDYVANTLVPRIAPGSRGMLTAKTLNKQQGVIMGVGKAAYVRRKVVG